MHSNTSHTYMWFRNNNFLTLSTEVSLFFFPSLQWVSHLKWHATCLQSAFFLLYSVSLFSYQLWFQTSLLLLFFLFLINFSTPVISAGAQINYLFLNCCHCNEHTSESCPFSGFLLGCQNYFFFKFLQFMQDY